MSLITGQDETRAGWEWHNGQLVRAVNAHGTGPNDSIDNNKEVVMYGQELDEGRVQSIAREQADKLRFEVECWVQDLRDEIHRIRESARTNHDDLMAEIDSLRRELTGDGR